MKTFISILILYSLSIAQASICKDIHVLSHFNSIGHSGTFYGNEIYKGVLKARREMKDKCYNIKKVDIGENLKALKDKFLQLKSDEKYLIGLGSSNKVKAIKSFLENKLLISPTATSNEFKNHKNIFLTSGINENLAISIAKYVNNFKQPINIVFDIKDVYSIDLKNNIVKHLNVPYYESTSVAGLKRNKTTILLYNELNSSKLIQQIDNKNLADIVIGGDMWGPKKIYLKKAAQKLKNIRSLLRFFTYKDTQMFDSDIMYYSYLSMIKMDSILTKCKEIRANCLNENNYNTWEVRNEEI